MSACPICAHLRTEEFVVCLNGVAVTRCPVCCGESYRRSPSDDELTKAYCRFDAGELVRRDLDEFVRLARDIVRAEVAMIHQSLPGRSTS